MYKLNVNESDGFPVLGLYKKLDIIIFSYDLLGTAMFKGIYKLFSLLSKKVH